MKYRVLKNFCLRSSATSYKLTHWNLKFGILYLKTSVLTSLPKLKEFIKTWRRPESKCNICKCSVNPYHHCLKSVQIRSYSLVFGLNTEICGVDLRIQSECRKIRTRNNSVFGHFLRSALYVNFTR